MALRNRVTPLNEIVADPAPGRWWALFFLSLAELGALSLWFSAAAVLPSLSREWHLGDGGRAGLTIAVQAGFIVGTLGSALANLPDVRALLTEQLGIDLVVGPPEGLAMWLETQMQRWGKVVRDNNISAD
jgi:hypothetical protein